MLAGILKNIVEGVAGTPRDPTTFPTLREEWNLWIERRKHTYRRTAPHTTTGAAGGYTSRRTSA